MKPKFAHGAPLRGLATNPRSSLFEGTFGRMFRTLPAAVFLKDDLINLAKAMSADPDPATPPEEIDSEENSAIDAGYTYLGQFIDHDLTFDPASSLQRLNDPDGLVDYRTPRFDLDSMYGRGPDDQPYLYASDGIRMLLGRKLSGNGDSGTRDLPRIASDRMSDKDMPDRALIGDPRNDENVIVSQLHAIFLRFHNRVADFLEEINGRTTFGEVQKMVRWHYQWVVLYDFLPTIIGQQNMAEVLPGISNSYYSESKTPNLEYYSWKNEPYMPVEFSVAAYRFGHSMVRPFYLLNKNLDLIPLFDRFGKGETLVGFHAFPENWAIDWDLFFGPAAETGRMRVQKSYKIDTSVSNPMANLPNVIAGDEFSIAARNLLRGNNMGLPSGQDIARLMGLTPIPDEKLIVGKATVEEQSNNRTILEISPNFKGNAPLWFYILAEARHFSYKGDDSAAFHLGPVGSRIVGEVFLGLLLGDFHSFLYQDPNWKPFAQFQQNGTFKMRDLIRQAKLAK